MSAVTDTLFEAFPLLVKITSFATSASGTFAQGDLTGSQIVIYSHITTNNPGTITTRTAALMIADAGLVVNQKWLVIIANNQGTGTLTVGGGTNVTIAGTAGVLVNTARPFQAQVTSATAITLTGLAISWSSAV